MSENSNNAVRKFVGGSRDDAQIRTVQRDRKDMTTATARAYEKDRDIDKEDHAIIVRKDYSGSAPADHSLKSLQSMVVRKFVAVTSDDAEMQSLASKRQVQCRCSTPDQDRDGDIVVQAGIDLTDYRKNPVFLFQHNTSLPVARALSIGLDANGNLSALVQFPPEGQVKKSDEVFAMIQHGIISGISIGFAVTQATPLDKSNPTRGPKRIDKCKLMEVSFVSVPSNQNALIMQRGATDGSRHREQSLNVETIKEQDTDDRARRLREVDVLRLKIGR